MLRKKYRWLAGVLGAALTTQAVFADIEGVGNTRTCPVDGSIEPADAIYIHIEAWPAGASTNARVVYTSDGTNWVEAAMYDNGEIGRHDWWVANIGSFPAGTTIRYAVEVFDVGGGSAWDTNDGADYFVTVNGGSPVRAVENTVSDPPSGQIGGDSVVTVTTESFPVGDASSARLVFTENQGYSWTSIDMAHAGTAGANDVWSADIGPFEPGSTNLYAVEVTFGDPSEIIWDTNNGANYQLVVNAPFDGQWIGNARHTPPSGDIDEGEDLTLHIESRPQGRAVAARAVWTSDDSTWISSTMTRNGTRDSNDWWTVNIGSFAAGTVVQYAFEVDFGPGGKEWDTNFGANYLAVVNSGEPANWAGNPDHYPESGEIDPEDDLWINVESRPLGFATNAGVVYSVDGGTTWTSTPMSRAGLRNGNDHWNTDLGTFPQGTVVEYAIQVNFTGQTIWVNNAGDNYFAVVNSPDPVDWIGDTYNWPAEGAIDPGVDVWINTSTGPEGSSTNVRVVYSTDDGATWSDIELSHNGASDGHDHWRVNLGGFPEGTIVRYAVYALDALGGVRWDSNGGEDYYARVHSLIRDVFTDKSRYDPGDNVEITVEVYYANGTNLVLADLEVRVSRLFTNVASFTTNLLLNNWSGTSVVFNWEAPADDFRGYGIDVDLVESNVVRDRRSSAIDVSSDWTKFPRYGFFSDYYEGEQSWDSAAKAKELGKYHINAVQFYDWMWEHDRLIKYDCGGQMADLFEQIDGRTQSFVTVSNKVQAAWARNMFPMAYSLLYGDSGIGEEPANPEWAAYTEPFATAPNLVKQHNLAGFTPPRAIWVMDVSNSDWQGYIFNQFKDAITKLDFGGIHLDNLGGAWNYRYNSDSGIEEWNEFPAFIDGARSAVRDVRGDARVIHNDVFAGYMNDVARSSEDVYYAEVWGFDKYNDIAELIRDARAASGQSKQVVLAAYMNLYNYSNVVSEASVRLMDAVTFANGAFHIELGEGVEYLTNHYFPMHWPPARPSLKRALRYYYSFITRYQNLLYFNTLGGLFDATEGALAASTSHSLSQDGQSDTIYTVIKQWKDEFDTISLINLYGVDTLWRNRSARPPVQTNIQLKFYVDKKVQHIYAATPDDGLGRSQELAFSEGSDGLGNYVEVAVPRIDYWTMLILDKRTEVKIDGLPGDWTEIAPTGIHEVAVVNGEWMYTGDVADHRTFNGATADEDITEVRLTSDDTYIFGLVRMQAITNAALPALGIAVNVDNTGGYPWVGDASTPSGSIGLEVAEQFASRQMMIYTPTGGAPVIKLWDGALWYDPPSADAAVSVSEDNDAIEFRVNRADLGINYPAMVAVSLVSFRGSGKDAGSDATYDSPDMNNDAVDFMGGDAGISENAWGRDLDNNSMRWHYRFLLNEQGAEESIHVAWPSMEGESIDTGDLGVYTIVARFSESLYAITNAFTLRIDGVVQTNTSLYIVDLEPADFMNEIRFDWTDSSSGPRLIEWSYKYDGRKLYASRNCVLNPDTDDDGILDHREDFNRDGQVQLGETDADAADTDGDGLDDGFEDGDKNGHIAGDSNSNLVYEAGEIWTETDPRKPDTDGDGLSDGWEVEHGMNPWDDGVAGHTNMNTGALIVTDEHGSRGDPDGDGVNNGDEQRAGTDPRSNASVFHIVEVHLAAGQGGQVTWSSVSGKQYRVYATPSLNLPYQPMNAGVPIPANDAFTVFVDGTNLPDMRHYQLRLAE